jgi:hypothetical protein
MYQSEHLKNRKKVLEFQGKMSLIYTVEQNIDVLSTKQKNVYTIFIIYGIYLVRTRTYISQ